MKKLLVLVFSMISLMACNSNQSKQAETKEVDSTTTAQVGKFNTYNLEGFKLHVYNSNDVMADASYIIEGEDELVVMEYPLFKDNAEEFNSYIENLGKTIVTDITDYHLGGSDKATLTMPEGMSAFIKGPIYSGMMEGFAKQFGDSMVELPTASTTEVPFGSTQTWAGVDFRFEHGASSDFPGASIIIGGQVYYTHWTPAEAHISPLQVGNASAVDAEIAETQEAIASGCKYFIGGHGGLAEIAQVEFKLEYLTKVKELLSNKSDATSFVSALKAAYPELPGDADALANALYAE